VIDCFALLLLLLVVVVCVCQTVGDKNVFRYLEECLVSDRLTTEKINVKDEL
jgi:hypothetical protein